MACANAIRCGKQVLLLEKNTKLGVKILMSGGTRCNITHSCGARGIVEAFGPNGRFLHSPLAALSPADVVDEIESAGVATKVESTGKVFPLSDRAIDVRDALVALATEPGCPGKSTVLAGVACQDVRKTGHQFTVDTQQGAFTAAAVLITTGGKSYPQCGTDGDGYVWAGNFGHRIQRPVPALTPITNTRCWSHNLKGITLDDVAVSIAEANESNQTLDQRRGGFLFTHFGYSGPAALNISRTVSLHPDPNSTRLLCDFAPELSLEQLQQKISATLNRYPKHAVGNVLAYDFQRRFVEQLFAYYGFDFSQKSGEFSRKSIAAVATVIKRMTFPVGGVYGFAKAEVTAGGVCLDEIDSRTMQSKLCPGLFFAGEVIDLDGPIGGYNFQAAFSTGWLAGGS